MFRSLILLVLFINNIETSFGIDSKEVFFFGNSLEWKRSLFYQDNQSKIISNEFFFSKNGHKNPVEELKVAIEYFKKNQKHANGEYYQCLFPYRFAILNKRYPNEFKKVSCKTFDKWSEDLALGDMYLVFTSSYASNPASMFGHTFIRFDRSNKGELDKTKSLLGYSFAYQARTNPNENPFTYTFKGLFGGYFSYLEIKPHYFNVGIYNNAESRDLWEYKVPLTKYERESFKRLSWELSHSGAFKYYFFDENCSTLLLYTLEAIRPKLTLKSKKDLFVVPQVTLREIIEKLNAKDTKYQASIERKMILQLNALSSSEKKLFKNAKESSTALLNTDNINVLELLVDYWKYKNYQEKTNLKKNEKKMMYLTLKQRSLVKGITSQEKINLIPKNENPAFGHGLKRLRLGVGDGQSKLGFRYGFHDFFDPSLGFDKKSYIRFLDFNLNQNRENTNYSLKIADILSLNDFYLELPKLSWRGFIDYEFNDKKPMLRTLGAVGLSDNLIDLTYYTLLGLNSFKRDDLNIISPVLNLGFRINGSNTFFVSDTLVSILEQKSYVTSEIKFLWKKTDQLTFGPAYRYSNYAEYLFEGNYYF